MKRLAKILTIWFLMGMCYFTLEGLWRIPKGGYANISMLVVGGLCGFFVGSINQVPKFYRMKVITQSAIGTLIVLIIEYLSGLLLNCYLGLHIWDYSNLPFNIHGQVCLIFGILWFLLMPLCIWLEDKIRYLLWHEGTSYSIVQVYKEFITFQ